MLMIPKKEIPVSSAHIPKIPPKDAIWSDQEYLASKIVISILEDGNFKLTIMTLLAIIFACFE